MFTFNVAAELIPGCSLPTVDARVTQIFTLCMAIADGDREAIVTQRDDRRASFNIISRT